MKRTLLGFLAGVGVGAALLWAYAMLRLKARRRTQQNYVKEEIDRM